MQFLNYKHLLGIAMGTLASSSLIAEPFDPLKDSDRWLLMGQEIQHQAFKTNAVWHLQPPLFTPYGKYSNKGNGKAVWKKGSWDVAGRSCNENEQQMATKTACYTVTVPLTELTPPSGMSLTQELVPLASLRATLTPVLDQTPVGDPYPIIYTEAKAQSLSEGSPIPQDGDPTMPLDVVFYLKGQEGLDASSVIGYSNPTSANNFTYKGRDAQ